MSKGTLYDKVWDNHTVKTLKTGQTQLFVGRHLIHEVTSPQFFDTMREEKLKARRPDLTFATIDHILPSDDRSRPFKDEEAELMASTLETNARDFGINFFAPGSGRQGVIHVTMPEQGVIWPGQVVVGEDSHTSTHGAFGNVSIGIGTTEGGHVLATQTLSAEKLKVRRVNFEGSLGEYVTAKDIALHMIRKLGVAGGLNYAYELGGSVIDKLDMEQRMTVCNMSIEGGARSVYVLPDKKTFSYLKGRPFAPKKDFKKAVSYWKSISSDHNAEYDDVQNLDVSDLEPMVTWGVNPEQVMGISELIPPLNSYKEDKARAEVEDALKYTGLHPNQAVYQIPIDVAFIGSCTNGRLSDLIAAAEIMKGHTVKVRTLVVPGSELIKNQAEALGLDRIFNRAKAEWRYSGCSMCLAMNSDKLLGNQRCASTSNRNFKGRQGSTIGITHLMSPYTAAASAIMGYIADPRDIERL